MSLIDQLAFRILRPLASSRCLDASLRVAADHLFGAAEYALVMDRTEDYQQLEALGCAVYEVINNLEPETQRMELNALLRRAHVI